MSIILNGNFWQKNYVNLLVYTKIFFKALPYVTGSACRRWHGLPIDLPLINFWCIRQSLYRFFLLYLQNILYTKMFHFHIYTLDLHGAQISTRCFFLWETLWNLKHSSSAVSWPAYATFLRYLDANTMSYLQFHFLWFKLLGMVVTCYTKVVTPWYRILVQYNSIKEWYNVKL